MWQRELDTLLSTRIIPGVLNDLHHVFRDPLTCHRRIVAPPAPPQFFGNILHRLSRKCLSEINELDTPFSQLLAVFVQTVPIATQVMFLRYQEHGRPEAAPLCKIVKSSHNLHCQVSGD